MAKTVLLVVRTPAVAKNVIAQLAVEGVRWRDGHTRKDVQEAFVAGPVDHVIFGGGLALEERLDMVRDIFEASGTTTVHLNAPTGPDSFLPFVRALLGALVSL